MIARGPLVCPEIFQPSSPVHPCNATDCANAVIELQENQRDSSAVDLSPLYGVRRIKDDATRGA